MEIKKTMDLKNYEICSIKYDNTNFKEYADFVKCQNLIGQHKDCIHCIIWINHTH